MQKNGIPTPETAGLAGVARCRGQKVRKLQRRRDQEASRAWLRAAGCKGVESCRGEEEKEGGVAGRCRERRAAAGWRL